MTAPEMTAAEYAARCEVQRRRDLLFAMQKVAYWQSEVFRLENMAPERGKASAE